MASMSKESQPRPAQATLAGALIIGGSAVVVLTAWQRISTLHTIEVQEELRRALTAPPFSGLGLSMDDWTTVVRVLCMIAAGSATAATILGFQVYKRSTSARLALTLLAPLILIGGLGTAGFFAPMVVAGITLLWLQPTRDWYAGRPWLELFQQRRAAALGQVPGQPAAPPVQAPAGGQQPEGEGQLRVDVPPPPVRRPRPSALVWACVLTWVGSGLSVLGLGLMAATMAGQRDELMDELRDQQGEVLEASGLTESQVLTGVYVMVALLALWAIGAMVLAGFAFVGHNWARITLAVSAAASGSLFLLMALAGPPLIVLVAVSAASLWLLLRPDVAAWFRR
jgi:hypothetical protein